MKMIKYLWVCRKNAIQAWGFFFALSLIVKLTGGTHHSWVMLFLISAFFAIGVTTAAILTGMINLKK